MKPFNLFPLQVHVHVHVHGSVVLCTCIMYNNACVHVHIYTCSTGVHYKVLLYMTLHVQVL